MCHSVVVQASTNLVDLALYYKVLLDTTWYYPVKLAGGKY
jgi:hypothetical protein